MKGRSNILPSSNFGAMGCKSASEAPSEVFGDDAALRRLIAGRAGEGFTVRAGMGKHLAPAILSLSGVYPSRTSYRFMGWTQIDGRWTYITPTETPKQKVHYHHGTRSRLKSRFPQFS